MRPSFLILFVLLSLMLPNFAKSLTKGFKVAKLKIEFPDHPEWDVLPSQEVLTILDQPFSFLDKGSQAYVFESQDQKYVLKLFRYDKPIDEQKVIHLFIGCKTAFDHLKEETGIVYIHLNVKKMGLPTIICQGPIGRRYRFDLNQCRFALQKKASPLGEVLMEAKKDPELMKGRIDAFLDLLVRRTEKHIFNSDPSLSRNFGFLGERALEIDFGNLRPCGPLDRKQEIQRYTKKLARWLFLHAPEYVGYLEEKVEALDL